MSAAAPGYGATLDRWFDLLDTQGFRIGLRERLTVQSLLARRAAQGELPATPAAMLALVRPLLCTNPQQQRHYELLLATFDAAAPAARPKRRLRERLPATRRSWWVALLAALLVAGLLVVAWKLAQHETAPSPAPPVKPVAVPGSSEAAPAAVLYVPPLALPIEPARPPPWSAPARAAVIGLGGLALAALLAWFVRRRRRHVALQGVRTDEEVERHLLFDDAPVSAAPHPTLARAVARALRQRVAGDTLALDLPATLRATIAAHGALSPRWRELRRTPEYLVLIESRHRADHLAAHAETLADALARAGVALQVWMHDGAPEAGCWLRGASGNDDAVTCHRVPLGEVAARHAGHRLLAFGPAEVLMDPATGGPAAWTAALGALAERAWFTPRPLAAWGAAETAADALGVLVLPLQEAALETLAGWLTSSHLDIALDADSPASYPALLDQGELVWVTRSDAPPGDALRQMLQQLRRMLGGQRFQWLAACAIFPAVTPPLTLALGCEVVGAGRALALGFASLAALPWFRWGQMPAWLREALLAELSPELRARLRGVVEARLARALQDGGGPALAEVATRRRVLSWLARPGAEARDVVLADFIQGDELPPLAQKLPDALRRRLFRNGRPRDGLRPWTLALPGLAVAAGLVAATPLWTQWVGVAEVSPLQALGEMRWPEGWSSLDFVYESTLVGPDRIQIVDLFRMKTEVLKTPAVESQPGRSRRADGTAALRLASGGVQLVDDQDRPIGSPLPLTGGALEAVFTPSGSRVVVLMPGKRLLLFGRPWGRPVALLTCRIDDTESALARSIAAAFGSADFSLLPAATWEALVGSQVSPQAGQILFDEADRALADGLANTLRGRVALNWQLVADATIDGAIVGLCLPKAPGPPNAPPAVPPRYPKIDGLSDNEWAALTDRVESIFAANADTRDRMTAALASDAARLSDVVTLALARAVDLEKSRLAGTEATPGVINTLELLKLASPATLRRLKPQFDTLAQLAADKLTAEHVLEVRARVVAASKRRPVVTLQMADERQRPLMLAIQARLQKQGWDAPGIELVSRAAAPSAPEVRALGNSDRAIARLIGASIASATNTGRRAPRDLPNVVDNDRYEVGLDAKLCVTVVYYPACPGPEAAASAPTPVPAAGAAASLPALSGSAATSDTAAADPFEAVVFECSQATRADLSSAVAGVEGVVRGLGLQSRREGTSPFKELGAQVAIKGYPLHAEMVKRVYEEFGKRGYSVSFELTDIGKLYTPADVKELAASGFKVTGVPRRLLISVCGAPSAAKK